LPEKAPLGQLQQCQFFLCNKSVLKMKEKGREQACRAKSRWRLLEFWFLGDAGPEDPPCNFGVSVKQKWAKGEQPRSATWNELRILKNWGQFKAVTYCGRLQILCCFA
jgi:hypothetical protein